ncbi:hypothetical protein COCSADRAFT_35462, partial [Bipolaris sorokiniana ND90Pr]
MLHSCHILHPYRTVPSPRANPGSSNSDTARDYTCCIRQNKRHPSFLTERSFTPQDEPRFFSGSGTARDYTCCIGKRRGRRVGKRFSCVDWGMRCFYAEASSRGGILYAAKWTHLLNDIGPKFISATYLTSSMHWKDVAVGSSGEALGCVDVGLGFSV